MQKGLGLGELLKGFEHLPFDESLKTKFKRPVLFLNLTDPDGSKLVIKRTRATLHCKDLRHANMMYMWAEVTTHCALDKNKLKTC